MSDPATQAALETAAGAGVVLAVSGSVFGMDAQGILCGFVGAIIAESFMPTGFEPGTGMGRRYVVIGVKMVAAGLLAGLVGPIAEALAANLLPGSVPAAAIHLAIPGLVGIAAPVIVPAFRNWVKTRGEREAQK